MTGEITPTSKAFSAGGAREGFWRTGVLFLFCGRLIVLLRLAIGLIRLLMRVRRVAIR